MQRIFLNISIKVGALYVGKLLQIQLFQFRNISVHPPQSPVPTGSAPAKHKLWDVVTNEMLWIEYYHIYETKLNLLHKSNFQLNQTSKVVHTDK